MRGVVVNNFQDDRDPGKCLDRCWGQNNSKFRPQLLASDVVGAVYFDHSPE
jgi:hypothetical protein